MAHNSGARPERMKVMALTAREHAARTAQALAIVDQWNAELGAGKLPQFSPTLEAAFRARRPWLTAGRSVRIRRCAPRSPTRLGRVPQTTPSFES